MVKYPKLLIAASFPPGSASGSWSMMEQLIKDWPRESLIWWSLDFPQVEQDIDGIKTLGPGVIPKKLNPHVRFAPLKSFFLEKFYLRSATTHLKKTIEEMNPEIIWMVPHVYTIPVFHKVMKHGFNQHHHVSIHDRVDLRNASSVLGSKRLARYKRQLEELYQNAASRDAVTTEMEEYLFKHTEKRADVIVKFGAEPDQIGSILRCDWRKPDDVIRIGYAGTIVADDAFELFVKSVQYIRHELPHPVEIHLFSGHDYRQRAWYDESLIVWRGFLKGEEFKNEYKKCHWALVLMNLDDSNHNYSGFSIPCKLTHALSEGLPIICIAHSESTLFKLVDRYQAGVLFAEYDAPLIKNRLIELFSGLFSPDQLFAGMAELLDKECNARNNRDKIFDCFSR